MTSQEGPISPDPANDRPLPVQRAFVVQLHATPAVAEGQLSGRVEHVLLGQAAHFRTLDELPAFIARVTIKQHFKSRGHWLWASASSLEAWCSWLHYLSGFTVNQRVNLRYMGVFAPAV